MIFKVQLTRETGEALATPKPCFIADVIFLNKITQARNPTENNIIYSVLYNSYIKSIDLLAKGILITGDDRSGNEQGWVLTPLDKEPAWGKDNDR